MPNWTLALGAAALATAGPTAGPKLPARLANYRAWRAGDQHALSIPLSILCIALPPGELARLRAEGQRTQGPHAERYLRVYANPKATSAAGSSGPFPAGSIIAKEKLLDAYDRRADGVAFMIKHADGAFPESGGWEFRYYPEPHRASYKGCIDCHRSGATRDYVFSRLKP